MNHQWRRCGRIYNPADHPRPWARFNSTLPTPIIHPDGYIRLFVGMGAENLISRIGYVDLDQNNPQKILAVSQEPVLDIGAPGCFDDNGVVPIQAFYHGDELVLIYVGFQLHTKIPYTLFPGLAYSKDNGLSFYRKVETPFFERLSTEKFFRTAPHLRFENNRWKAWYIGGNDWIEGSTKQLPVYQMRYAESPSLDFRTAQSKVILDNTKEFHGYGRPVIVSTAVGNYQMHYSARSITGYRLRIARSNDGISWLDHSDLQFSHGQLQPWESDMTCFAYPLTVEGKQYLFYNGNEYGRSGVGLAFDDA